MKKQHKKEIREVALSDVCKAIPDLHYTALATIPADDAMLIVAGHIDEYEASATLPLTPRRRGKLYLRASARYQEADALRLQRDDPEYYAELLALRPQFEKMQKSAKVTFTDAGGLLLPVDCVVGSCFVDYNYRAPRVWCINRAVMLDTFRKVPSRGGFYFLREVNL